MWDNPSTLNRASDLLFVAALLLVLYGAVRFAIHQPVFALREIRVINNSAGGQGSEALRRDELEKRLKQNRRERLEIGFSGGRNMGWVCRRHGGEL